MVKFLNLVIKIKSTHYKNDTSGANWRIIEPISLEIRDQNGINVSKLKTHIKSSNIGKRELPVGNIRKIKLFSSPSLDIPISWVWKNKGHHDEIKFILKKIKYDEQKGFWDGDLTVWADTLFLSQDDFEVETFESRGEKFFHSWQIFEVEGNGYEIPTFHEFSDLYWKIVKAREDESITPGCPLDIEVKEWKNSLSIVDEKGNFYETESINGHVAEAEKICEDFLKEVGELNTWKTKGIKTLLAAQVAKKNGFDIIANPSLESQITNGKYQGFPIADGKKYQCLSKGSISSGFIAGLASAFVDFSVIENRFTKKNIDVFRGLFANNQDQTDPKYFLGFRPGEIYLHNSKYYSYNHRQDFQKEQACFFEIEPDKGLTRTYYEFRSCNGAFTLEEGEAIKAIIFRPEAFNELPNKSKKEHWDIYWKWMNKILVSVFVENYFGSLHRQLTKLLPLLDKPSFAGESQADLEVALKVLQNYESPTTGSDQAAIERKFSSEIKAKRTEITSLMKKPLEEEIEAAANEDYGSGSLSPERKKIFTVHKAQIENETILAEIKQLIKLLVKGEKLISETYKRLDKKALVNKLKTEYQNG